MAEPQTPTTLVDWLDDLTVRFLLNLPASELSSVPRLCFQVEEAQWFYEDFVRPAVATSGAPPLPNLPLRQFCLLLFQHCPLLSGFTDAQHIAAYEEFLAYKVRVPVRGAILLDKNMEKVVLVRGWKKGASWSFPRGKINKDEKDLDCAIREVYEETGYDIRQGGLVPENEEDAKYIDITMREQHMRLFVFRGVPDDTYFEPKTRKEIGKIQWYSIRDLPGFKKQKVQQGQGGEAVNANKFYMVAPFLGPLKKWINLQRKKDEERRRSGVVDNGVSAAQTGTEDEGEVEEEQTPERDLPIVDHKTEELRRLLSIGRQEPQIWAHEPPKPDAHSDNLLAMLQGAVKPTNGNQLPHTPLEQINAFPQQPETPQPDHLRHPSLVPQHQQPPPPQFPFSPQRVQQQDQLRHFSPPTPNVFGPGPGGFHQPPPPGFPGMLPPHMQQQQQRYPQRQSMPPGAMPGMPFGHENGFSRQFNGQQMPPPMPPPPQMRPPQHMQQHGFQHPPPANVYLAQGPQGAIGSGPTVPNASQLPPPRLNAQSLKLLDAFKRGSSSSSKSPAPPAPTGQQMQQRPTSTHQSALLDLFRKPSTSQSPVVQPGGSTQPMDEPPASPTLTDTTIKASKPSGRKPTLNEITRTLPARTKARSPRAPEDVVVQATSRQLRGSQLWDPNDPTKFPPLKPEVPAERLQHPPLGNVKPRSPRPKNATTGRSPSRRDGTAKQNGNHTPPPQFTILARPGSAKGSKSPAPPRSPLRHEGEKEKPAFQPQVLKRPKEADGAPTDPPLEMEQKPADKKDHLLALFGKGPTTSTLTLPASQPGARGAPLPPQRNQSQATEERKNSLLDLFNTPSTSNQPTPTPPPAPRIEPEHRPTSSKRISTDPTSANRPQQQSLLLDLFSRKDSGTPITSPGTPISPFTLGTPATATQPAGLRSRLGSVDSSGTKSPVEAKSKEFLMGYLNGVVKNEGQRAAGRRE